MWVMTNVGFISAVAYPGEEHLVLVRARAPGHLTEIFGEETEEIHSPRRDYAWRTIVTKTQMKKAMDKLVDDIDYTNFKDSVKDEELHDAYVGVWTEMYIYQGDVNRKLGYQNDSYYLSMSAEEQQRHRAWWEQSA